MDEQIPWLKEFNERKSEETDLLDNVNYEVMLEELEFK